MKDISVSKRASTPAVTSKTNTTSSLAVQRDHRRTKSLVPTSVTVSSAAVTVIGSDSALWKAYHWERGIAKARKRLSEKDQKTFDAWLAGGNSVDAVAEEMKAEMSSHNANTDHSVTAFRLQKLLRALDKYGKVVDVCVQHSPEVTALVWGSMRLVIDVCASSHFILNIPLADTSGNYHRSASIT